MATEAVIIKCTHGLTCLQHGQALLHPDSTRCPDTRGRTSEIAQVDPPVTIVGEADDAVLTPHRVVRDGSVWFCQHCGTTRPFGKGAAAMTGPCVPRRWGDQPLTTGYER